MAWPGSELESSNNKACSRTHHAVTSKSLKNKKKNLPIKTMLLNFTIWYNKRYPVLMSPGPCTGCWAHSLSVQQDKYHPSKESQGRWGGPSSAWGCTTPAVCSHRSLLDFDFLKTIIQRTGRASSTVPLPFLKLQFPGQVSPIPVPQA